MINGRTGVRTSAVFGAVNVYEAPSHEGDFPLEFPPGISAWLIDCAILRNVAHRVPHATEDSYSFVMTLDYRNGMTFEIIKAASGHQGRTLQWNVQPNTTVEYDRYDGLPL